MNADPKPFSPLPAIESSDASEDLRPTIVIDTREQAPLAFRRLPFITGTLRTGDYSLAGAEELFAVERKSVADLVACCSGANRERFEREMHRLRGYRFKRLLVVGARAEISQHRYRSNIAPAAILGTLAAFEVRYDVPVIWIGLPECAARRVEHWAWWYARELLKTVQPILRKPASSGACATA